MLGPRVVLVASLLVPLCAQAAPPEGPDRATVARARELSKKGQAQYDKGAYKEALVELEAALALVKAPETILAIAHCHRLLEHDVEALQRYGEYLAAWEAEHPETKSPEAEQIDEHVAALRERIRKREAAEAVLRVQRAEEQRQREEQQRERAAQRRRQELLRRQAWLAQQPPPPEPRRVRAMRIATVSGAALTASAVVTGAMFQVAAHAPGNNETFESARNVSTTGFVLAGVFGAAAVTCGVLYLLWRPRAKTAGPAAAAAVAPIDGGAAFAATLRL